MNANNSPKRMQLAHELDLHTEQQGSSDPRPKRTGSPAVLQLLVRGNGHAKKSGHICLSQSPGLAGSTKAITHRVDGFGDVFRLALTLLHQGIKSTTIGLVRQNNSKCICYGGVRQCVRPFNVFVSFDAWKGGSDMTRKFNKVAALLALGAAVLLCGCAAPSGPPAPDVAAGGVSGTWAWRYRTYDTLSGEEYPAGRAELSGHPGAYRFRLVLNQPGTCAQAGPSAAVVAEDTQNTIITVFPPVHGCEIRRFTIRKDGTGGQVETKVESKKTGVSWVLEERDRGLTPL